MVVLVLVFVVLDVLCKKASPETIDKAFLTAVCSCSVCLPFVWLNVRSACVFVFRFPEEM